MTAQWWPAGEDDWLVTDDPSHRLLAVAPHGIYPCGVTVITGGDPG